LPPAIAASSSLRAGPADQFNDDIDLRHGRQGERIVMPAISGEIDAAVAAALAGRDGDDLDRPSAAPREICVMRLQQLHHTGADGAQARDSNAQRLRTHGRGCPWFAALHEYKARLSGRGRFRRAGWPPRRWA
jgi:hypothetical protein